MIDDNSKEFIARHIGPSEEEQSKMLSLVGAKNLDELIAGSRVDISENKKNPEDFVLWKPSINDEPFWDSPWGPGRPGWHIECSAMSEKCLGTPFDIHCGGVDLTFPHHENEIAQSEAHSDCQFAKIWMHVGMVTIMGEKMSKSLGNTKSIKFVLENWGPNIIRLFCLSGHYSKVIDYSEELLKENLTKWRQVETCYFELIHANSNQQEDISEKIKNIGNEFDKSLEDDLNTHLALSAFFQLVKETNRLAASEKLGIENAKIIMDEFQRISNILGLKIPQMNQDEKQNIDNLISSREKLRTEKQFEKADEIRDKLNEMNIE